ncbi:hypothetical protein J4468_02215 [Candidatus Woesearchaeota archaeon]|nr:hypothetical protein [Candidatus Woesearchaeota archaeon]
MADTTTLGVAIEFLNKLGFFDVVLPFLLVFTIVFGVLEKTRLFGTVKLKDNDVPRKDLNSMIAFAIALFVVSATKIVQTIKTSMPQVALGLIIIVSFMMLVGMLLGQGKNIFDKEYLGQGWVIFFGVLIFIGLIGVFIFSLGWWDPVYSFMAHWLSKDAVLGVFILLVVAFAVTYIVGGSNKTGDGK